jgi:hypothetical protein
LASNLPVTISEISYVACFSEDDGIYSCGHLHPSVRDAMNCLVPDGGSFVRAYEAGAVRSLTNGEFIDFLEALAEMPWNWRNVAQGGDLAVQPLNTVIAE